jgi:hypothetical protein
MSEKPLDRITGDARKADAVAIAKVKSVGAPPPAWSGVYAAHQQVEYRLVRWLKKPAQETAGDSLVVFHPVVAKSLTADEHHPKLRESVFRPGAEVILFLRMKGQRMETFDENHGVVANEPKTEEAVILALNP